MYGKGYNHFESLLFGLILSKSIFFLLLLLRIEYSTVDTFLVSLPNIQTTDNKKFFFCVDVWTNFQPNPCSSCSSTPVPSRLSGEYVQYSGTTCTTLHVKRMVMVVIVGEDEGQKAQKKSFWRWWASRKRKMYVPQDGIINNTVTSECRREQWHCVEKRWQILLSFFSETALSINYFYVFIHYSPVF